MSKNGENDESHNLLESIQEESGINELDFWYDFVTFDDQWTTNYDFC